MHAARMPASQLCPSSLAPRTRSALTPAPSSKAYAVLAHALGLPIVTGLKKIELRNGAVRCERDVGGARDVYEAPLPALLTVLEGLNLPRYPSVPGKLRAKQKPLDRKAVSPPAAQLEKIRLVVPEGQGKQAEILGEGAGAAPRVVELMQELGVA